jgi:tetratricopeptide (TPR) repeat protein
MRIFTIDKNNVELKKNKKSKKKRPGFKNQLSLFSSDAQILRLTLDTRGYFETALKLDEEGDPRASEFYLKAIEHDDSTPDAYCNLGVIEADKGDNLKGFSYFLNALRIDPSHAESHFNIANLYFEMDDHKLAELHYLLTIELAEDFSNVYFNMGLLYLRMEQYIKAEECFLKYKQKTGSDEWKIVDQLLAQMKTSVRS